MFYAVKVEPIKHVDDSFWPTLDYSVGSLVRDQVPVISGLEHYRCSRDDLKSFFAAFATASTACHKDIRPESVELGHIELLRCWNEFNNGSTSQEVQLISLENPHLSLKEIKKLADLCKGRIKDPDVAVILTSGRAQHALAVQAGYVEKLERFGVQFLNDTCWCFIEEPIIPSFVRVIMTNSGKYAHYGLGLTGKQFRFGSFQSCIDAACTSSTGESLPKWLRGSGLRLPLSV